MRTTDKINDKTIKLLFLVEGYLKQLQWVAENSKQYDTFNEDIIRNIRKNDDIAMYLDETWKEIVRHLPNNMKYLGYHYDDSIKTYKDLNLGKKKSTSYKKIISIYPTYARKCVFEFELQNFNQQTGKMDKIYMEAPMYIPLYIDDYHFYIHGNKYIPPYQITDAITYSNKSNIIVLKTKTRAIKLARERRGQAISDLFGNKYTSCYIYYLYMSSKKVPFLLYYFAYFGFKNTLIYFGADRFLKFYNSSPIEPDDKNYWFKFGTMFFSVDKESFDKYYNLREFIFTLLECQKRNMGQEEIENVIRWKIILGATISESNALEKGEGLVRTLKISLDHRTIKNIENIVGGAPKTNMWSVIRWMFLKFSSLSNKSNSLLNKRIRVSEWLIDPFLKETYKKLYRYLSTSEKSRDMNRLIDIVRCPEGLLIGAICGKNKRSLSLDIAKYSSNTNDNSILEAVTWTAKGPGSPASSESSGSGGALFRVFNPSYVGRIDLYASSNSDPGSGGHLTLHCKIDTKTLTFEKYPEEISERA